MKRSAARPGDSARKAACAAADFASAASHRLAAYWEQRSRGHAPDETLAARAPARRHRAPGAAPGGPPPRSDGMRRPPCRSPLEPRRTPPARTWPPPRSPSPPLPARASAHHPARSRPGTPGAPAPAGRAPARRRRAPGVPPRGPPPRGGDRCPSPPRRAGPPGRKPVVSRRPPPRSIPLPRHPTAHGSDGEPRRRGRALEPGPYWRVAPRCAGVRAVGPHARPPPPVRTGPGLR